MKLLHFYKLISEKIEHCFNVQTSEHLTEAEYKLLYKLLADGFDIDTISDTPHLDISNSKGVEIGPLMNFDTQFSSQNVSICNNIGLNKVVRLEKSIRYLGDKDLIVKNHCISTIQTVYDELLESFESGKKVEYVRHIQLIQQGIEAFDSIEGLSFSDSDKEFYYDLFVNKWKRNPTDVELFDLLNYNCEHSRHGIFNAKLTINGIELEKTLFSLVKATQATNPENSVIAFHDNSSAIKGFSVNTLVSSKPGYPSGYNYKFVNYDITLTAETHNFPTGIDADGGAETGAGGRIRDGIATGRGSYIIAAGASYSVGGLLIPGYKIPGETEGFLSPSNMVQPLDILIKASNSASNYCNEFGEPCITGSVYSFDMKLPNNERWAYVKPIMFTSGIGSIRHDLITKDEPQVGFIISQMGGAARRIGFGGGNASSMHQGDQSAKLDFNAVQRGDAEMERKVYEVLKTCNDMGVMSPLASVHDQGAAGIANVLKELVKEIGGTIEIRQVNSADGTLSVLEIWVCEYQERIGFLVYPDRFEILKAICKREKVPLENLGLVTGDGRFTVTDSNDSTTPVNFDLQSINGDFPQAEYSDVSVDLQLEPFIFPDIETITDALINIFKLVQVGSKSFLTSKVDRSVTGLVAQQQCVGPLHLPLANNGVIALSHIELKGAVTARGEKPHCMIVNPAAGARMSVGEMLTNMVWTGGVNLNHIKCSTNWMWAPKKPGELVALVKAAVSMTEVMPIIGIASDGGKDSFSMATDVDGELVKSPRTLVVSGYCDIRDITKIITPDIKDPGNSQIIYIDISKGKARLGGSALAQAYYQIGNESPDMDDPDYMVNVFLTVQKLIEEDLILAGHDISDGGLITSICEMAFAGNCGLQISMTDKVNSSKEKLFSEELGLLIEVCDKKVDELILILDIFNVEHQNIGRTSDCKNIHIVYNEVQIFEHYTNEVRSWWYQTSYQLEKIQSNPDCAEMEKELCYRRDNPVMKLCFMPYPTQSNILNSENRIKVAVLREEGSNGQSEMKSALTLAGFDPYDVCMQDLLDETITLEIFQGLVAVGGFSYGDYPMSAKGWAITIRSNPKLSKMFDDFKNREDTFSFGVCNGCQMLSLLGWVSVPGYPENEQPMFIENVSGFDVSRSFESRYPSLLIPKNKSIMFTDMEGSILPVWSAHGEGRFSASQTVTRRLLTDNIIGCYTLDNGNIALENKYPFNPNGSPYGIAGLCSDDGRHTIMMPHPERLFTIWQFPWLPKKYRKLEASPWLKIFQNARIWCESINKNK